MSLLNPFMLFGLVLAAVPLVIHLLNRNRFRTVAFGAMMFLQSSMKAKKQTLKFRQLLLLILRTLFILLLVLALSRPANLPMFSGHSSQPTTHVLIIDDSLSMHQGQGINQAFELARKKALDIVEQMKPYDNMLIILAGRRPKLLIKSPLFDKIMLQKKLKKLRPGYETSNIPRALDYALWQLESSTLPRHRIYLFTDRQKINWKLEEKKLWSEYDSHRKHVKVHPAVYIYNIAVEKNLKNAAPVRVFARSPVLDCFRTSRFTVELANYAQANLEVSLSIFVDGIMLKKNREKLVPGINTFNFDYEFKRSGSHYLKVSLDGDDFSTDNTLYYAVNIMKRIPVLLISRGGGGEEKSFAKLALEMSGRNGDEHLFAVTEKSITELDMLSLKELNRYKCVILDDVSSFSDYARFNLERFVEAGGGLLVAPGAFSRAESCNKLFKAGRGVLPCQLVEQESFTDAPFVPVFPPGKGSFILDVYNLKNEVVLGSVKVREYWKSVAAEGSVVFAYFGEDPFLTYKKFGKGQVILWTCGLGVQWSNFPYTRDYLPLLHNLVIFLSGSVQPPLNIAVNDLLVYSTERPVCDVTSAAPAEKEIKSAVIIDAANKKHKLKLNEREGELIGKWKDTADIGLYRVETPGIGTRYFAVSADPLESRLSILPEPAQSGLARKYHLNFVENDYELHEEIKKETGMKEWWRKIFLGALILLCLELLLSWRFSW